MSFWNPLSWLRSSRRGPAHPVQPDEGVAVKADQRQTDSTAPARPSRVRPELPILKPSQYVDFIRTVLVEAAGLNGETEGIQVLVFSCYFNDGDLRCYVADDHTWSQRSGLWRNVTVSWRSFIETLEAAFAIGAPVDPEKPYPILIAHDLVPYGSGCDRYYCVLQCTPDAVRSKRRPIYLGCDDCCCCDCLDH